MEYTFAKKSELRPIHELPDPFLRADGTRISSPQEWPQQREYLKAMLTHYLYGTMPPPPGNTRGEVTFRRMVYHGQAIAETIHITCGPHDAIQFDCEMIRPAKEGRVPVITWNQFKDRHGSPYEEEAVLEHGYAIIEFEKEQLAADSADAIRGPLATAYPDCTWGAIAMWAWAQSRVIDYLETTDYADMNHIVATGHSRGGKVALCAAIYDERIALCAASGSGCCGAGCLRYLGSRLGEGSGVCETAGSIEDAFPFWWCDEFGAYGLRSADFTRSNAPTLDFAQVMSLFQPALLGKTKDEVLLPFDLHFLRACIAPRPVITTEGLSDTWANPYGSQITWRAADEVYQFLGAAGKNAIAMRDGPHEYQRLDWEHVISFCDAMFFGKPMDKNIQRRAPDAASPMDQLPGGDWKEYCQHFSWRMPRQAE